MKSIAVFCGSSSGGHPIYAETAKELGAEMARQNLWCIYGGGNVGLMGVLADSMLEKGGKVIGVIPYFLKEREVCHDNLTELFVVDSMHERKVKMAELSEGVIVLPGGYGTLDELFEMVTLVQLSQEDQPIGILNVNGYYDHLIKHIERMEQEEFLKPDHKHLVIIKDNIQDLITAMQTYEPKPQIGKWVDRG